MNSQIRRTAVFTPAVILGLLFTPFSLRAVITAQASAARTAGVAPLAVFFDATGTTADFTARPFHELEYKWDFGDPGSGAWGVSGQSKNATSGPVAAHVFETPGVYAAQVTVKGNGQTATQTVTITVGDPNTVFTGTKTVCFSIAGDFTGAPAGSTHVTVAGGQLTQLQSYMGPGKRLLLRRGETWTAGTGLLVLGPGPGIIGAFGAGARPVISITDPHQQAFILPYNPGDTASYLNDWRIMDLEIDGTVATNAEYLAYPTMSDPSVFPFVLDPSLNLSAVGGTQQTTQLLILRVFMHDVVYGFVLGADGDPTAAAAHDQIAVVDSVISSLRFWNDGYGVYIGGNHLMFLGDSFDIADHGQHVLRVHRTNKAVISDNDMKNAAITKHVLKIHGPVLGGVNPDAQPDDRAYAEQIVVSRNRFSNHLGGWVTTLGPADTSSDERVRDVIFERNLIAPGTAVDNNGGIYQLLVWARDVTVRNNIFKTDGYQLQSAVFVGPRGIEPPPVNVSVVNNTSYSGDPSVDHQYSFLEVDHTASSTTARNNLVFVPGTRSSGAQMILLDGGTGANYVADHNLFITGGAAPFSLAAPVNAADFQLVNGDARTIDQGIPTPLVTDDYNAGVRPLDGDGAGGAQFDLGAFEYGTLGLPPDTMPPARPKGLRIR